ncbi:MAG: ATP-binding protein [Victivallaceae bacterium]|nr:ATP-binding protein [Victivallaceae bacterium]
MFIERHLKMFFEKASGFFPAVLVTGARQVGKTTFLKMLAEPERKYVTLDNPELRALAKEDPHGFINRFSPPVLIDEIQYVPELLNMIKIIIDEKRFASPEEAHGLFWLAGSLPFELMKGVTESPTGRIGIFEMTAFSRSELEKRGNIPFTPVRPVGRERQQGKAETFRRIWQGSYPKALHADAIERDIFYSSYVNTFLERDVRNLAKVRDLEKFYKFLKSCAARTGRMLNCNELARDCEINVCTAQSWLSMLVSSRIVFLLPAFAGNLPARLVKSPKLYFLDTGLCSHLTGWPSPETLESGAMSGAIFETWCISEILKSYWNAGRDARNLFHYRDKGKREIDLIIDTPEGLFPVECKKTSSPKPDDVRHFKLLEAFGKPVLKGALLCTCDSVMPLPNMNVACIPAGLI